MQGCTHKRMLLIRSEWQILARFSQLLEETEHFCGCGQEEVAKIVQCGEHEQGLSLRSRAVFAETSSHVRALLLQCTHRARAGMIAPM